jgi:hypothetical protein
VYSSLTDGLISPKSVPSDRTRSNSRVRFDLDSNVEFPHEQRRPGSDDRRSYSDSEETVTSSRRDDRRSRRRGRRARDPASQLFNDKYERRPHDSDSEDTVELPRRFDEHGNRKPDSMGDELAERLQDLLSGRASSRASLAAFRRKVIERRGGRVGDGVLLIRWASRESRVV